MINQGMIRRSRQVAGGLHCCIAFALAALPGLVRAAVPGPIGASLWVAQGAAPVRNTDVAVSGGEANGAVQCLAIHPTNPNIMFIGAVNGGIWRTANATAASPTWTPLADFAESLSITSLEFDPTDATHNTLVAGLGSYSSLGREGNSTHGVLRTTDGGTTWGYLNGGGLLLKKNLSGVIARGNIILASVDEAAGNVTSDFGIYRSTNTGVSFAQVSTVTSLPNGLPYGRARVMVGDATDNTLLYTVLLARNGGINGVFKSTDTGATWAKVSTAAMDTFIGTCGEDLVRLSATGGNLVYFGVADAANGSKTRIFRSNDGGASWADMGVSPTSGDYNFLSLLADTTNPNVVYVAGTYPFRGDYSQSVGNQYAPITGALSSSPPNSGTTNGTLPHADIRNMRFDLNGNLVLVCDGGVYRRTSPGSNQGGWISMNGNLQVGEMHNIAYDARFNVITAGTQDVGTQRQAGSGQLIWNAIARADGGDVAVDTTSVPGLSLVYAILDGSIATLSRLTFNSAMNLVSNNPPTLTVIGGGSALQGQFVTPVTLNAINPQRLVIGGANSVYESLDRGATITEVAPGRHVGSSRNGNGLAYGGALAGVSNPDVLYAAADTGVFVRTNGTGQLAATPTPFPGGAASDVVLMPTNWLTAFVIDSSKVFMTTNAGSAWTDITGNLTAFGTLRCVRCGPTNQAASVLVGTDLGVYVSSGPGFGFWNKVGTNLPHAPVFDLEYNQTGDLLVVGTLGRGAWMITNASMVLFGPAPPVIGMQPQDQTVPIAGSVFFDVSVGGTPPFTYQWRKAGAPLVGATNATLTLSLVQTNDAGGYSVVVSNGLNSVTSVVANLTIASPPVASSSTPAPTGLVAWWTADDTANDRVGLNHGALQNGTGYAPGMVSQAFAFDGIDDFVEVPDSASWAFGANEFSIDLWANFSLVAGNQAFLANDEGGGNQNKWIFWREAGQLRFHINGPGGSANVGSGSFSPIVGQWNHLAVTRSGTTYRFYVNGAVISADINALAVPNANAPLTIAQAENSFFYGGLLDDVRIYNRALSPSEIQAIFAAGTNGMAPPARPSISVQPLDQSVAGGNSAFFSVTAAGSVPISYQWQFGGANLPGATNPTLSVLNVQVNQAGAYSVVVSNALGAATSSIAVLTVLVPPSISVQPASQSVSAGNSVTFSVVASGTLPLSYQWRVNGVDILSATNPSVTLTNVLPSQAGNYSVRVGNSVTLVDSSIAVLTVNTPPLITSQPQGANVNAGASVTFTVVASGTAPLTYRWRRNATNLVNATNASFTVASAQSTNAGNYSVVVSNALGSATSADAPLLINGPPLIIAQPQSATTNTGSFVLLSVIASSPLPVSYQWRRNGANLSGQTLSGLLVFLYGANQAGDYTVVLNNSAGSVTSAVAVVTLATPPVVTSQPQSVAVAVGGSASFTVAASGTAPFTYQWQFNGTNLAAATNSSLTLAGVGTNDMGLYRVAVTNMAGGTVSSNALLTVVTPPVMALQPQDVTVFHGSNATFQASVNGLLLFYQWQQDGLGLAGRTNVTLTLTNVVRTNGGLYSLLVSNLAGSVTSANAALSVHVRQRMNPPAAMPGGTFRLRFGYEDSVGLGSNDLARFEVQTTTNFLDWETLTNGLALTNGQLQLDDPVAPQFFRRFYRIIER